MRFTVVDAALGQLIGLGVGLSGSTLRCRVAVLTEASVSFLQFSCAMIANSGKGGGEINVIDIRPNALSGLSRGSRSNAKLTFHGRMPAIFMRMRYSPVRAVR